MTDTNVLPPLVTTSWKPYRLFDKDFVSYEEGKERFPGAATVVVNGFSTSYSSLCRTLSSPSVVAEDDGMVTLNIRRVNSSDNGLSEPHALNGSKYADKDAAQAAAFGVGALAFMVYEEA